MKKLINGIIDFQKNVFPERREIFAKLALGQSPDTLFIACSDSRVAPNWFASTNPGDLFVIRNVGNLIPPCGDEQGLSAADVSEAAAIEFAILNLGVKDIIICGHSDCGAMHALFRGRENIVTPNLKAWLRHGEKALTKMKNEPSDSSGLAPHNRLSQLNVLKQIENLKSYPIVQEKLRSKELRVHAWWFELSKASVYFYDPSTKKFTEVAENKVDQVLESLE